MRFCTLLLLFPSCQKISPGVIPWKLKQTSAVFPFSTNRISPVERKVDIVFTGNYSPLYKFDKYINRLGGEYEAFYRGILAELLKHPEQTLEDVAERHIRREIPEGALHSVPEPLSVLPEDIPRRDPVEVKTDKRRVSLLLLFRVLLSDIIGKAEGKRRRFL